VLRMLRKGGKMVWSIRTLVVIYFFFTWD
jgi:hypothetical protein